MQPIQLRYARRRFLAVRDAHGVPHVEAPSWREALYALGYLHALDRPTQMLFGRTVASGRAAEMIGATEDLLDTDRFFRRAGLQRHLDREVRILDDPLFDELTFYCEGVNDGMKDAGRSLPMWATGFRPQPWNHEAVLMIGRLLSFAGLAVSQQQNELLLLELIQLGIAPELLKELFTPSLDDAEFDLLQRVNMSNQLSDEALELIADLPRLAGSNAWAIAPTRSQSRHALLAADPHLEVNRLPAIWYEIVLHWKTARDGMPAPAYVMGATLPGCPLFAVARTARLSWGVTYMKGDTSDYFIEDCRKGGSTGWQYRRGDRWYDFRLREEPILKKDGQQETLRVYENDVGTLESDMDAADDGYYLSVAWTGSREGAGRAIGTWIEVVSQPTTEDAMRVVRSCPLPSLVWVFADADGHIGKQACGWFPKRPKPNSGLLPLPAWDTSFHWQGRWESSCLPCEFDPSTGFVSAANENINPPDGPQWISLALPDYRKRRIDEQLRSLDKATIDDMQALQYDVVSLHAKDLLAAFLPHMPDGQVKQRLEAWDFRYTPGSREATLFQHLYRNVLLEVFGHQKGIGWRRMLYLCTRVGYSTMVLTCIDRLLARKESSWWKRRGKAALIRRATERLENEKDEPWSAINTFSFVNRFFEGRRGGRLLGFHTSRMAMPGCHATPFQGHLLKTATRTTSFAPSYHFVTDMGTHEAWTNLPGGPRESRFSKYYKNDIALWAKGLYKRLSADDGGGAIMGPG